MWNYIKTTSSFYYNSRHLCSKCLSRRSYSTDTDDNIVNILTNRLNITEANARYIIYKQPTIRKIGVENIDAIINTVTNFGFSTESICQNPQVFNFLPSPLKHYYDILNECGFQNIEVRLLTKYLNVTRRYTVTELMKTGRISKKCNLAQSLANCLKDWPTSRTNFTNIDYSQCTVFDVRMKVLQRYTELILDLSEEKFYRSLKIYPRIKHRSFHSINTLLKMYADEVQMPLKKIRSNLFLLYCDIDNLKLLLYKLRKIAGVDIKVVLRAHPILCNTNYKTFVSTGNVLNEYQISEAAQIKCFEIYTLSTETVKQRLDDVYQTPEFRALVDHPRILRLIYYRNKAKQRLEAIHKSNKKCTSLHILSCSGSQYQVYEKSPGDRTKGKDLIYGLSTEMDISVQNVKRHLMRHPFWINIPLLHAKDVYQELNKHFSELDILENCPIVLYPKKDIKFVFEAIRNSNFDVLLKHIDLPVSVENTDLDSLSKKQLLSLIQYFLEKKHYFSGNGVWTDEKQIEIIDARKQKAH